MDGDIDDILAELKKFEIQAIRDENGITGQGFYGVNDKKMADAGENLG